MSTAASRVILRQRQILTRNTGFRHASTTAETASKAKEAASDTASKVKDSASNAQSRASQGLSRVTSSAGPAISGATEKVASSVSKIGGRTGRLISFIQSMIPPTIYYSKVTLELSKIVFKEQKMSPPNLATFQSYFSPLLHAIRNPMTVFTRTTSETNAVTPESVLNQIRNVNRQQMVALGVVFAEVLGFFTVGEMIGRLKVVGYRGDVHHHETATPH